ncbi:DUF2071 domain-containing protein [Streptomyces sp. APSN-46.1]|uniref:DUF2071 domain-containing protein n=1 Tax=Streptomyces sp. APSN-46.1 TaxID=2929049 RepID=UPI001FB2A4A9|nr:DUF2071 domain-containing protein [Streptomyces sp. APSN-46.1]MCJ1676520.1 DUF2071 domain-containing protein [Streptomyces sp. APSN-46.1]
MRPPKLASVIERRLLVNYRVDPDTVARLLPEGLRPQLTRGHAVAGICLLRLGSVRPAWAPAAAGLRSENAAHRVSVEWDGPDGVETGVYIPRRDTASLVNRWAGGRIFPGEHGHADFTVRETDDTVRVAYETRDGGTRVDVEAEVTRSLEGSRLFSGIDEASAFFRDGSKGWSPTRSGRHLDGMQLRTDAWRVEPARITSARSSFFDDPHRFPPGTAELDSVLLMRGVPVRWHSLPEMPTAPALPAACRSETRT